MRHAVAVLGVALLLATGCSDGDGERGSAGAPTTETPSTSAPSTTVVPLTTAPVLTSSVATTRPGSTSPTPTTTAPTAGPAAVEAGGWRLVIRSPIAPAIVPPAAVLCYEVTGTSREPVLALEVTALPPGSTSRIPIAVGRGSAAVDLSAAGAGPHDLRIQLVVDGERIAGLAVTLPVTVAAGAPATVC